VLLLSIQELKWYISSQVFNARLYQFELKQNDNAVEQISSKLPLSVKTSLRSYTFTDNLPSVFSHILHPAMTWQQALMST